MEVIKLKNVIMEILLLRISILINNYKNCCEDVINKYSFFPIIRNTITKK